MADRQPIADHTLDQQKPSKGEPQTSSSSGFGAVDVEADSTSVRRERAGTPHDVDTIDDFNGAGMALAKHPEAFRNGSNANSSLESSDSGPEDSPSWGLTVKPQPQPDRPLLEALLDVPILVYSLVGAVLDLVSFWPHIVSARLC